ncbi:hypothetical protein DWW99_07610 [[Clostridium] leptum]|nr:hypothetical protein DWW99_07610 [[Clostridium] leptum]
MFRFLPPSADAAGSCLGALPHRRLRQSLRCYKPISDMPLLLSSVLLGEQLFLQYRGAFAFRK